MYFLCIPVPEKIIDVNIIRVYVKVVKRGKESTVTN
jgi:hypothetical protein